MGPHGEQGYRQERSMILTEPESERTPTARQGERVASRKERRRQLINATIDSIAERGFSDTTLETVSKGAGLSHGTINFHFKSKDLLFVETLKFLAQEHYDHWSASLSEAGPMPREQLIALIETDFAPAICNPKKLAVWFAFWGEAKARPAYLKICDRYDQNRLDKLTKLGQALKEEGAYENVNPRMVAKSVEAFVDGLWLNMLLYPDVFQRDEARQDCLTFLAGVFPRHFPVSTISSKRAAELHDGAGDQPR
jgi:TetR/AcrR family transcriptional repressor of bet genes